MRLINSLNDGFWVIAHRGSSNKAPENTMSAFTLAYDEKADMIELDVLLTKDGVPIVVHDNRLKKLGYSHLVVTESTFNQLKEVDAGRWFSPDFAGEKIPSLEQVLNWAKDRISLNIEIKKESVTEKSDGGIEQKVIDMVRDFDMTDQVLLSSFDFRAVDRCKKLDSTISTGLLYDKKQSGGASPLELIEKMNADAFHCTFFQFYRLNAQQLLKQQIPVFIYTVNYTWMMKNLLKKGVNGLFTDKPELLKKVVQHVQ